MSQSKHVPAAETKQKTNQHTNKAVQKSRAGDPPPSTTTSLSRRSFITQMLVAPAVSHEVLMACVNGKTGGALVSPLREIAGDVVYTHMDCTRDIEHRIFEIAVRCNYRGALTSWEWRDLCTTITVPYERLPEHGTMVEHRNHFVALYHDAMMDEIALIEKGAYNPWGTSQ